MDKGKLLRAAREVITDLGQLPPMLIIETPDQYIRVLFQNLATGKEQLMFAVGVRTKDDDLMVEKIYFLAETWLVTTDKPLGVIPSEHPDRKEALVIVESQRKGKYHISTLLIQRTHDGPVFAHLDVEGEEKSPLLDCFWQGYGQ